MEGAGYGLTRPPEGELYLRRASDAGSCRGGIGTQGRKRAAGRSANKLPAAVLTHTPGARRIAENEAPAAFTPQGLPYRKQSGGLLAYRRNLS